MPGLDSQCSGLVRARNNRARSTSSSKREGARAAQLVDSCFFTYRSKPVMMIPNCDQKLNVAPVGRFFVGMGSYFGSKIYQGTLLVNLAK